MTPHISNAGHNLDWWNHRLFPFVAGLTLIALTTSGVQPIYLTTFGVWEAVIIQAGYGLLLLAMAIKPDIHGDLHKLGAITSVLIFVGKSLGFAHLVFDGSTNLIGPVGERLLLALSLAIWHMYRLIFWTQSQVQDDA